MNIESLISQDINFNPAFFEQEPLSPFALLFKNYFIANSSQAASWQQVWDTSPAPIKQAVFQDDVLEKTDHFFRNWGRANIGREDHYAYWSREEFCSFLKDLGVESDKAQAILDKQTTFSPKTQDADSSDLTSHPGHQKKKCPCSYRDIYKEYLLRNTSVLEGKKRVDWKTIWEEKAKKINVTATRKMQRQFEGFYCNWANAIYRRKVHYLNWQKGQLSAFFQFIGIPSDMIEKVVASQKKLNPRLRSQSIEPVPVPTRTPKKRKVSAPSRPRKKRQMKPAVKASVKPHPGHQKKNCGCLYRDVFKQYLIRNVDFLEGKKRVPWKTIWEEHSERVNGMATSKMLRLFERFCYNWGIGISYRKVSYLKWPNVHLDAFLQFIEIPSDMIEKVVASQRALSLRKRSKPPSESENAKPPISASPTKHRQTDEIAFDPFPLLDEEHEDKENVPDNSQSLLALLGDDYTEELANALQEPELWLDIESHKNDL